MAERSVYDRIVDLLRTDLEEKSVIIRWMAWRLKLIYEIIEKFWWDNCPVFAASLAYTTLLALAPLAAVSLSVFSSFEFSKESVLRFVFQRLLPNEELARVIEHNIDTFAANAASVSILGMVILVVFSVWVMSTVEAAFNMIWKVERSRSLINQFVTYWSAVTISPILIAVSIIVTARIQGLVSSEGWAEYTYAQSFVIKAVPFVLTWIAFFLVYKLVPFTTVYFKPALIGAITAGTMFELAKFAFDFYVRNWASYTAVYGALAAIPIFLFWLYVTWLIVLLGSVIAYAIQYPKEIHTDANAGFDRSCYLNYYALRVLVEALRCFEKEGGSPDPKKVQEKLEITGEFYNDILQKLHKLELIEYIDGRMGRFLFNKPPEKMDISNLVLNLGGHILTVSPSPIDSDRDMIGRFFNKLENAIKSQPGTNDLLSVAHACADDTAKPEVVKLVKKNADV